MNDAKLARFWSKVSTPNITDCWEWKASTGSHGYGQFGAGGKTTHRQSWEMFNGPIPSGKIICHKCDNRACVNPMHLFVGTHADNMNDKVMKGRQPHGAGHWHAKLDENAVRDIRRMVAAGLTQREAGQKYGVGQSLISNILTKRLWKHIKD